MTHRVAQVAEDAQPAHAPLLVAAVIEADRAGGVAAVGLGDGSAQQQLIVRLAVLRVHRDADRGAHADAQVLQADAGFQALEQAVGEVSGALWAEARHDHEESVALEARQRVLRLDVQAQLLGGLADVGVRDVVPEGAGDFAEAIEIEHHDRHVFRLGARLADRRVQVFQRVVAIGQPGKRVVPGLVGDARLAAGDVFLHGIEGHRQFRELIAGGDGDRPAVVAHLHALRRLGELLHWLGQGAGEQHGAHQRQQQR